MKVLAVPSPDIAWRTLSEQSALLEWERSGAAYAGVGAIATAWAGIGRRQLQLVSADSATQTALEQEFNELADTWERATRAESFAHRRSMHPAYQRIVGLGEPAVGLILERMRARPGHWFWALNAMTGEDPATGTTRPSEAREAWLRWGVERGYLPRDS
jgi:hypothetical protein